MMSDDNRFEKGRNTDRFNETDRQQQHHSAVEKRREAKLAELGRRERITKTEQLLQGREEIARRRKELSQPKLDYDAPGYSDQQSAADPLTGKQRPSDYETARDLAAAERLVSELEEQLGCEGVSNEALKERAAQWRQQEIRDGFNRDSSDRGRGE